MRKVKSRKAAAKVTRPTRSSPRSGQKKPSGRAKSKRGRVQKAEGSRGGTKGRATIGAKTAKAARPELQIRELDPVRVCGGRTSVVQLFRVDEQLLEGKAAGARQVHLVFNDRHGWYCEHGRSCHAVSAVMRHAGIR